MYVPSKPCSRMLLLLFICRCITLLRSFLPDSFLEDMLGSDGCLKYPSFLANGSFEKVTAPYIVRGLFVSSIICLMISSSVSWKLLSWVWSNNPGIGIDDCYIACFYLLLVFWLVLDGYLFRSWLDLVDFSLLRACYGTPYCWGIFEMKSVRYRWY